ncbi:MAG: hypothetical protein PHX08_01135 [Lachnospiraceae bacterium]|nr:hypothetical protein [Lachnospiraceae bacterium]
MKTILKDQLENLAEGYISVGFYLKYTRDNELFAQEGYIDVYDFAQKTFGVSRTYANRWMNANDKYSIGGNSPEMEDKYRHYGSSQLIEMMSIPDEIAEEIPPAATIRDIREVKQGIKQEEDQKEDEKTEESKVCDVAHLVNTECEDDSEKEKNALKKIIFAWFKYDKKEDFESFYNFAQKENAEQDVIGIIAIINPTKFKMVRTSEGGMILKEDGILPLAAGAGKISYKTFTEAFREIYKISSGEENGSAEEAFEYFYNMPLKPKEEPKPEPKEEPKKEIKPDKKPVPKVAPKQEQIVEKKESIKEESKREEKEEQIPGQTSIEEDFKEILPEHAEEESTKDIQTFINIPTDTEQLEEIEPEEQEQEETFIEITEDVVQDTSEWKIKEVLQGREIGHIKKLMIKEFNCPLNNPLKCPHKCNYDMMECTRHKEECWDEWLNKTIRI